MERQVIKTENEDVNRAFDFIAQNAVGNPTVFKEQPTAESLKANTIGVYNNVMYIKFANGKVYKFTGTAV